MQWHVPYDCTSPQRGLLAMVIDTASVADGLVGRYRLRPLALVHIEISYIVGSSRSYIWRFRAIRLEMGTIAYVAPDWIPACARMMTATTAPVAYRRWADACDVSDLPTLVALRWRLQSAGYRVLS